MKRSPPPSWIQAARSSILFGFAIGFVVAQRTGHLSQGIIVGAIAGPAFGYLMFRFARSVDATMVASKGTPPSLEAGEKPLRQGVANHWKGIESVGGKLYLTSETLRFCSHGFNVQTHDESYPLADIVKVETARTLGIIPNGLLVHLTNGRRERFVVDGNRDWVTAIDDARGRVSIKS